MAITNSYINTLRYVSASGKKSILETAKTSIQKGAKLKYTGPVEYKTVPLGMPKECKGVSYNSLEKLFLENGGSQHFALNGWFNFITPPKLTRIEQETKNCFKRENIEKIEFFKTLSKEEKDYLVTEYPDIQFLATLSGHKPAWYCEHGFNNKIDFSKIKLNPKVADKYDVVKLPKEDLYFLNKQEVLKIIEENRDVYCALQKLKPNEDTETIYNTLLKNLEKGTESEALFGITLGFPRHSSMIYELERFIGGYEAGLRENIPLFKTKLLEALHSEKSPFKNCPKETIEQLKNHINSMTSIGSGGKDICHCITFGNEEKALNKIQKLEEDFNKNFKAEDLM